MSEWINVLPWLLLALLIVLVGLRFIFAKAWKAPWHLHRPLRSEVCIQGDLLVAPRRLTEACLPFDPADQLRLRSGALLWASAATVTHTLADERDRNAILAAVKPLGFTPEKFLARCPILGEVSANGQRGYVVRDGNGYRAYFLGEPAALLDACRLVWDQQEREKTPEDRARLPESTAGLYALAMAPADDEGVGPLTYLGSMRMTAPLRDTAPVVFLRSKVKALTVAPSTVAPEHNAALQALGNAAQASPRALQVSQTPMEHSFVVTDADDPTWARQIADGLTLASSQRRACLVHILTVLLLGFSSCVWALPGWLLPLSAALLLLRTSQHESSSSSALIIRLIFACIWAVTATVALRSFAAFVSPTAVHLALPIAYAAITAVLCFPRRPAWSMSLALAAGVLLIAGAWLWLQPPLLLGAFCLVAGLLHGMILRLLLGSFSANISANCS